MMLGALAVRRQKLGFIYHRSLILSIYIVESKGREVAMATIFSPETLNNRPLKWERLHFLYDTQIDKFLAYVANTGIHGDWNAPDLWLPVEVELARLEFENNPSAKNQALLLSLIERQVLNAFESKALS